MVKLLDLSAYSVCKCGRNKGNFYYECIENKSIKLLTNRMIDLQKYRAQRIFSGPWIFNGSEILQRIKNTSCSDAI